jgi:alpha-glucosidase
MYLDDGASIRGPSLRQQVRCTAAASGITLHFGPREGTYTPWWHSIAVTVHGAKPVTKVIPDQPRAATIAIR